MARGPKLLLSFLFTSTNVLASLLVCVPPGCQRPLYSNNIRTFQTESEKKRPASQAYAYLGKLKLSWMPHPTDLPEGWVPERCHMAAPTCQVAGRRGL